MKIIIFTLITLLFYTSCLKTRSEVSPTEQNYLTRRKAQEANKTSTTETSPLNKESTPLSSQQAVADDELVRNLNGRIEVLENQIAQLKNEQTQAQSTAESQKVAALQEALTKMELQIQKLEAQGGSDRNEVSSTTSSKPSASPGPSGSSSGESINLKKVSGYDEGEEFFSKKEWKKAILSYQKFVEQYPKSKLVPDAKYKTGVSFQELGLIEEARAFYEETQVQYPQTIAGKKSKIRLGSLNAAATKNKKK